MRIAVLIFAILGSITSGGIGVLWHFNWESQQDEVDKWNQSPEIRMLAAAVSPTEYEKAKAEIEELTHRGRVYPFLLAGAVLGLVGGALAMSRDRWFASGILLVAGGAPFVIYQDPLLLIATGFLLLAGLLALLVRPKSSSPSRANRKRKRAEPENDAFVPELAQ